MPRIPFARIAILLAGIVHLLAGCGQQADNASNQGEQQAPANLRLASLQDLSVESLRQRRYGSTLEILEELAAGSGPAGRKAVLAAYNSDGNRIYTRIDIPHEPPPASGYPALIFVHGWYGREAAPGFDFMTGAESSYASYVDYFTDNGFVVLSPGLRGHGTVRGVPADGIEYLDAWDNASYLSPAFYAIDVLNLLDGIPSLEQQDWARWGLPGPFRLDRSRIGISAHSQGADAALTALAVSGEGSLVQTPLTAGSIWSGCFGPRLEQAAIYGPMSNTLQAFMSGDGTWTGTAVGRDGSVNADFIFGFPPDWIGTVNPQSAEWTWQADTWSVPTVRDSLELKISEMYRVLNAQVDDIENASYTLEADASGRTIVRHDPQLAAALSRIGGFDYAHYLGEPLHFHISDQDYYSIPAWTADITSRINANGGQAAGFVYPQNSHGLRRSEHSWFSSGEVLEGLGYMMRRDLALFDRGETVDPRLEDLTSAEALLHYSQALSNELFDEKEREPQDGMPRRIVSFSADGLKQYALVMEPPGPPPENGWPVLLMNHGYHPDPPNNGRRADGTTDRPGDYYRGLPDAFARAGFLVVWPDYRGHNVSEGFGYTQLDDAERWYARDVIAAFRALPSLPRADTSNVFMWGHSMGGGITTRVLPAIGDELRGASVWSSGQKSGRPAETTQAAGTPLSIHHSTGDTTTPITWSHALHAQMKHQEAPVLFYEYPGEEHLFSGENLARAIERDIGFFTKLVQNP